MAVAIDSEFRFRVGYVLQTLYRYRLKVARVCCVFGQDSRPASNEAVNQRHGVFAVCVVGCGVRVEILVLLVQRDVTWLSRWHLWSDV